MGWLLGFIVLYRACGRASGRPAHIPPHPLNRLTYNYDREEYDLGEGFGHFAVASTDIYKLAERIKEKGGWQVGDVVVSVDAWEQQWMMNASTASARYFYLNAPFLRTAACRCAGGQISREPGPVKGGSTHIAFARDPTGYQWELIQREKPSAEPLAQVSRESPGCPGLGGLVGAEVG